MIGTFLTLWVSSAGAAQVGVSVRGVEGARAVAIVVDDGSGPRVLSCQDTGRAPDPEVDGSWTCQALQTEADKVWLALLTDIQLSRVGAVILKDSEIVIEQVGQGARLVRQPGILEARPDASPAGPGVLLITRVNDPNTDQAPMLLVKTAWGEVEHPCSDDGRIFDQFSNDEVYLCNGWVPGGEQMAETSVLISMRQQDGEKAELAVVSMPGGPGVMTLTVDVDGEVDPVQGGFSLRVRPGSDPSTIAAGGTEDVPAEEADALAAESIILGSDTGECLPEPEKIPAPEVPEKDPIGAALKDIALAAQSEPTKQVAGEGGRFITGGEALARSGGVWRILALFLAALLGLSWMRSRRVYPIPPDLESVGAPRLGQIGPRAEGDSIQIQTTDPAAALRSLVEHLSSHRRVVLLGVDELPEHLHPGHPVYTLRTALMPDALDAIRGLVKAAGPPVAVLIVEASRLKPGSSLSPTPLLEFLESLDTLAWSAVFSGPGLSPRPGVATWSQSEKGRWRKV